MSQLAHARSATLHIVTSSELFSHLFFVFSVFLLTIVCVAIGGNDNIKFVCFYVGDILQIVLDIDSEVKKSKVK